MTFSFPLSLSHIYNTTRFKISSHVLWLWYIKGTLMQIWKSPYMIVFIQKQCYENFAFLILTIARCLPVKFVKFLKSRLFFFFFFSHISRGHISKSKRYFNVKSSTYCFHMKTEILADFQICISVPFRTTRHFVFRRCFLYAILKDQSFFRQK